MNKRVLSILLMGALLTSPAAAGADSARTSAKQSEPENVRWNTRITRARDWLNVTYSDEKGMEIPQIWQFAYTNTLFTYNGEEKSVATSGCGAACVSMAAEYLTGKSIDPESLFARSVKDKRYIGTGWSVDSIRHYLSACGVNATVIAADSEKILASLQAGNPVIELTGPGMFTTGGHYIVLRGVTSDGKILINDPNSQSNSQKAFPLETLIRQAKGGTPFVICSGKE